MNEGGKCPYHTVWNQERIPVINRMRNEGLIVLCKA